MAMQYAIASCGRVQEIPILNQIMSAFMQQRNQGETEVSIIGNIFDEAIQSIKELHSQRLEKALLIIDHTTSNTAINFPIELLAQRAKQEGMLVLVDGAHGLLAQDVHLKQLARAGVDFYVSNCHKWLCSPRGAAFIYCENKTLRETILRYPAIMSHGVDDGYLSRFIWDGCRDYAAQLSLPVLIDFWNQIGPEHVRSIMRENLMNAVYLLSQKWHKDSGCNSDLSNSSETGVTLVPMTIHSPMALVRLPLIKEGEYSSVDAKEVQDYLFNNMIEAPIKCIDGKLYVRISSHIYNSQEQYDRLGDAILRFK